MGDRFAHQDQAQLQACVLAAKERVDVMVPGLEQIQPGAHVHRDRAVQPPRGGRRGFRVGARLEEVIITSMPTTFVWKQSGALLRRLDFFTIDVADSINRKPADAKDVKAFVDRHPELTGKVSIPNIDHALEISRAEVERVANKFLLAVQDAGKIYRHIAQAKGAENFISEVSMDETDSPQTPHELLIILAALADEKIPLQTIAPKFMGRFNKGVDYVGDLKQFEKEFNEDLAVIAFAIKKYGFPPSLKLSVHSGSDKFSIYEPMRKALKKFGAGLHLKTAGTTWLEELIGLAEAGSDGLEIAKEIYAYALEHVDEFCAPYATVIDIDKKKLPSAAEVNGWSSQQFVSALRHEQKNPAYNSSFRQLLHVSFKVAAKKGERYLNALKKHEAVIAKNVTHNLFERHLKPLLIGAGEHGSSRSKAKEECVA